MTNVEALKELYVALGGEAADVAGITENAQMIHEIAKIVHGGGGGGGGGLPDVTAADNGKALTVVDGEWGVAYPNAAAQ